jgi:uncharacterized protein
MSAPGAPAPPSPVCDDLVYVVAKAPRPGHSKTRLCPPLTHEQAADLARAFLLDTLALVRRAGVDARLVCRDAAEQRALAEHAPAGTRIDVQPGSGLGDALECAFARGLADGYRAVAVIGMDTPTLPPQTIADAFEALRDGADVSLGPSDDGGYYLLAATAVHPRLFRDMVWSTSAVARETLDRCRALALRVRRLRPWEDVDDVTSLDRLCASLRNGPATDADHTRRVLHEIGR